MRTISDADIPDTVNYREIIMEMKRQFLMVSRGTAIILNRKRLISKDGVLDVMGAVNDEDKIGVVKQYFYGKNIDFLISLFSTETSEMIAVIHGKKSTRIRTAAATALATDILSRKDSRILACIGAGYQALEQMKAISQIRNIDQVLINDSDSLKMNSLKESLKKEKGMDIQLEERVGPNFRDADILVTATTSRTPVIKDEFVGDRTHINSIGSYLPEMKETETSTICKSRIVAVDSIEETRGSVGELIDLLSSGCVSIRDLNEFTDLVTDRIKIRHDSGRNNTYFKSIGVGIEDLAVAKMIYERAI
jgi:ornithine cyclodeaminase